MASPLLIAALCMGKRQRKFFLFCFAGMGACLLSAYINTFFAALYKADTFAATTEIAPVVEEVMKLLPLLFYLLIFEPKAEQIKNAAVITALSFATFENVCYLIQNGAGHFSFIFFLLILLFLWITFLTRFISLGDHFIPGSCKLIFVCRFYL